MRVVNRSGQDIEYRVSGGGGLIKPVMGMAPGTATVEVDGWAVLEEGEELDIPDGASALEVRVGEEGEEGEEKSATQVILNAFDDLVEVGSNLKIVKILKTASGSISIRR